MRRVLESCTKIKMTIISIVDDDPIVREAIADLLQSLGYEVKTFASTEHFFESGTLGETSCLITDLQMPGLGGLELQTRLIAQGHATPVIFVTAFPEERFRQRAMNAGAFGFLSKPFAEDALIKCLGECPSGTRPEAARGHCCRRARSISRRRPPRRIAAPGGHSGGQAVGRGR